MCVLLALGTASEKRNAIYLVSDPSLNDSKCVPLLLALLRAETVIILVSCWGGQPRVSYLRGSFYKALLACGKYEYVCTYYIIPGTVGTWFCSLSYDMYVAYRCLLTTIGTYLVYGQ